MGRGERKISNSFTIIKNYYNTIRQKDDNGNDIIEEKETSKGNFQQRNINSHLHCGREVIQKPVPEKEFSRCECRKCKWLCAVQ